MSELVFAEKDADVILGEVLARYRDNTGHDLAPADPRRIHIQQIVSLLVQTRALINFSGRQNLLRYVSALYIDALAELLGETRDVATPSTVTIRFTPTVPSIVTIPAGKRVTNGAFYWAVVTEITSTIADYVDVVCRCTTAGAASNGYTVGEINTMVDSIPGIGHAANIDPSAGGSDAEGVEAFRERLRSVPESRAVAGPRRAYEALALAASAAVVGVSALGKSDSGQMFGTPPGEGEVFVLILEGTRDQQGNITSIIPEPSGTLITAVTAALTAEDVRPLTDDVTVEAPAYVDFDIDVTYYIAESRRDFADQIRAAVEAAFEAYKLAQIAIGKDINPTELAGRIWAAGAKRVIITSPASFVALLKDQCPRLNYQTLTDGGIEND